MKIREDLVLRHIGGEHVIVDPAQESVDISRVYTLNASAAWLWEALQGRDFSREMMTDMLQVRYELPALQAERDAGKLLRMFDVLGLLTHGA